MNSLASPLKKSDKINHIFDCKDYMGNTTNHFRSRWDNYKSFVRKAESSNMENVKQKFFQSHFLQSDPQGFLKIVLVRLISKTQASEEGRGNFTG